jgi:hypothetical protein
MRRYRHDQAEGELIPLPRPASGSVAFRSRLNAMRQAVGPMRGQARSAAHAYGDDLLMARAGARIAVAVCHLAIGFAHRRPRVLASLTPSPARHL